MSALSLNTIILAAGKGSRMKSNKLKVLHQVVDKPIISHVIESVETISNSIFLVIGHQSDSLKCQLKNKSLHYVIQEQQLGTGHAVQQVIPHLKQQQNTYTLILAGDCPLIEEKTLKNLIKKHTNSNSSATILSAHKNDPTGYGRLLRNNKNEVKGIKEHKDCSDEEKKITEINSGIYIFKTKDLLLYIDKLQTNNQQAEYYLTDIIHILEENNHSIDAYKIDNADEILGINTRQDLAITNNIMYQKINKRHQSNGVTIISPIHTFIDPNVTIGQDTIIYPFTIIKGNSQIGSNCIIHSFSYIENKTIDNNQTYFKQNLTHAINI